jgi:hypothetical protein
MAVRFGRPPKENILAVGVEPRQIDDPGDAGAISVNQPGYVQLVTTGAETRTLADPSYIGQVIDLFFYTDGGACVITAASPINQTGNTTMTFEDVGDHLQLKGHYNPTDGWEWRVVVNDGVTLG